jgi:hypothetical protein
MDFEFAIPTEKVSTVLDTNREYAILMLLASYITAGHLFVISTREPTWSDTWRDGPPRIRAWDYVSKEHYLIRGLYWVAGIYGIYNIQREKIWIGSSKRIYKRWNMHLDGDRLGVHNDLKTHLKAREPFLLCILEICEIYSPLKRILWWKRATREEFDKTELRRREQVWLDRVPKVFLYNKIRAFRPSKCK